MSMFCFEEGAKKQTLHQGSYNKGLNCSSSRDSLKINNPCEDKPQPDTVIMTLVDY